MSVTLLEVNEKAEHIMSDQKTKKLSKSDLISKINQVNSDALLDKINDLRSKIVNKTEALKELDSLFAKLTWIEKYSDSELENLSKLIKSARKFHKSLLIQFTHINNIESKDKLFRNELPLFKSAIDDFEESIEDINEIFFEIRTDDELMSLIKSA